MNLRFRVANALLLSLLAASVLAFGEDQKAIEKRLNKQMKGGVIELRIPRAGKSVAFDNTGATSSAEGIRGFDDKLIITKVKLGSNELVLKGFRMHDSYNASDRSVRLINVFDPVEVHLSVAESANEEAVAESCHRVFKSSAELAQVTCSDFGTLRSTTGTFKETLRVRKCVFRRVREDGRRLLTLRALLQRSRLKLSIPTIPPTRSCQPEVHPC